MIAFPGALSGQSIELYIDDPIPSCDAVCGIVLTPNKSHMLFVRHDLRGYEIPGGWVEPSDENIAKAFGRELVEEAGEVNNLVVIKTLCWYRISKEGSKPHVKVVVLATCESDRRRPPHDSTDICSASKWVPMDKVLLNQLPTPVSPLMKDRVFEIARDLANKTII